MSIEPIRKRVVVGLPPERAFIAFTRDLGRWWPRTSSIGERPQAGTRVTLEHRHLERYGPSARRQRELLGGGWPTLIDLFATFARTEEPACIATPSTPSRAARTSGPSC